MNATANVNLIKADLRPPAGLLANVGLIVLSTDEVGADAFSQIVPSPQIRVFVTRAPYVSTGGGFRLQNSFKELANGMPPPGALDILAFNCTSGTVELGKDAVVAQLSEARSGLKYTSPAIAGINALNDLGARRIALLTPYTVRIHALFPSFFERAGFEVAADATFGLSTDRDIGHLTKQSIFEASRLLTRDRGVDALFVSCTATPVVPHIEELERDLGIPVVTSSQALAWEVLRLAGYQSPVTGYGRLLTKPR